MTDNTRHKRSRLIVPDREFIIKRREERHHVSDIHRKYVDFKVKIGTGFVSAALLNFSRHGVMFKAPLPLERSSSVECVISITRSLSKNIAFGIMVKHCKMQNDLFLIGAAIEKIADETWFEILLETRDFILKREDNVF